MAHLTGHRALVTGASSGIGVEIARALARRGADLVITARRRPELDGLAQVLRRDHAVVVDVITADLAAVDGARGLWRAAVGERPISILVNNAGFGQYRRFADVDATRDAEMIATNVAAPVALCHEFVAAHRSNRGYILNVASVVAWQSIPNFATYGASKVFIRNLSEALHYELRERGIGVTCVCPGGTRTEFHAQAGAGDYGRLAESAMLDAAPVAEAAVRALLAGKKIVITGRLNRVSCWFASWLPRGLSSRSAARVLGPPRDQPLPERKPDDRGAL